MAEPKETRRDLTYPDLISLRDRGRSVVNRLKGELTDAERELSFLKDASEALGPNAPPIKDKEALPKILEHRVAMAEFRLAVAEESQKQLHTEIRACKGCDGLRTSSSVFSSEYKICKVCNGSGIER